MRSDRRGSWYLLTGAVLGIAMGLIFSWQISPVEYVNAPPYALRADYKDEYRALVAAAYQYDRDLLRAEDRLAQLRDDNIIQSLGMQAQQALAEGRSEREVQVLSELAMALSKGIDLLAPQIRSTQPVAGTSPTAGSMATSTQDLILPDQNYSPEATTTAEATSGNPETTSTVQPILDATPTTTP
jgi:hypothetical protein